MISATSVQATSPKRASKMTSNQSLNANHLLNFTLPPRRAPPPASLPRRSRKTGTHVWNKERFVNAQYRFVMNPTGDYTVHFADPDIFFQWHDILQVIIPRSSALASVATSGEHMGPDEGLTNCPICLSPPSAPRMTKCGHVFCFPCILHYLSTSDNKWARCPICFDSVNERQLKSVKWFGQSTQPNDAGASSSLSIEGHSPDRGLRTGSSMRMRLMQRPQITTLSLPRSRTWPSDLLPPHKAPFHFLPDVAQFAKFVLATPAYLISDLTKDLDELAAERQTLADMKDPLSMSFIDGAEGKVRVQMAQAAALETPVLKSQIDKALRDQRDIEERFAFRDRRHQEEGSTSLQIHEVPQEFLAVRSVGTVIPIPSANTQGTSKSTPAPNRNNPKQRRNLNPPPPSTSTYYYYQAASGLPLFLHPLDIRILLSYFNSYVSFPDTIMIHVESFAEGTVNDDLRKRCKYLAHMPEGTDVVFVEADLKEVVGPEGLKNFEGALKMRVARRKEKSKKDDRARARAEEKERVKERDIAPWTDVISPPSSMPTESPLEDLSPLPEQHAHPHSPPGVAGAWGARSFASALHSSPSPVVAQPSPQRRESENEWDLDVAWHELERTSGSQKKRGTRLVVLGSGSSGRRR